MTSSPLNRCTITNININNTTHLILKLKVNWILIQLDEESGESDYNNIFELFDHIRKRRLLEREQNLIRNRSVFFNHKFTNTNGSIIQHSIEIEIENTPRVTRNLDFPLEQFHKIDRI